ncbi:TonB-dependent receptor plug domain-containing protein [Mucilaginibacter auburnensis]|uniref:TonB-dependent receptor plug domain-containing protein n=1 Tax=Mucilaginibacter auburnensis TaxID=1457233 RepID=UPI001B7FFA85|nr:TonB-dependent receptor plug domain-containing protein [Mucilaginibacter auburnensis]
MTLNSKVVLRAWTVLSKKSLVPISFSCVALAILPGANARASINETITTAKLFQQQSSTVTGTVTDETNQPMPGVAVTIKGTTTGVVTDANGKYSIQAAQGATLVFSVIGYQNQEFATGNGTTINVKLQPVQTQLSEVVVVGYGTQKRETLTGSVAKIDGEQLTKNQAVNVATGLAGRLPGLVVNQRNGVPGSEDLNIVIRGASTFGNNNPLVVVDGVPRGTGGLSSLNPQDIESITVLKDGSAAIYGARAGNGVILVTTKPGSRGKTSYNLSYVLV